MNYDWVVTGTRRYSEHLEVRPHPLGSGLRRNDGANKYLPLSAQRERELWRHPLRVKPSGTSLVFGIGH